jgi:hypothetical protein
MKITPCHIHGGLPHHSLIAVSILKTLHTNTKDFVGNKHHQGKAVQRLCGCGSEML